MTLQQLQSLKRWHVGHHDRPLERGAWDAVLTLWMSGWIGGAASLLLANGLAWATCVALIWLPGAYVQLRARLHRSGRLRCDWITAIR